MGEWAHAIADQRGSGEQCRADMRRIEDAAYGLRWLEVTRSSRFDLSRSLMPQLPLGLLDDSLVRAPTLRSARLGLVGRCDHLLRVGDAYVPVEQKPSARRLQQSHILQVGALGLLVQDVYGARPPYGVVVLADGSQERVTFSEELERGVVRTMAEMRRILATGEPPGPRWVGAKCRACGYHPVC